MRMQLMQMLLMQVRETAITSEYRRRHALWQPWVLAAVLSLVGACSAASRPEPEGPPQPSPPPARTYVAVGASDTLGIGAADPAEAWPVVFHKEHLQRGTKLVVVGVPGATVSTALTDQLPRALAEAPTLATVWLNVNDLLRGVPPATYESQLRQLVRDLRRGGATTVLLANTPPEWILPRSVTKNAVDAYNAAIRRVSEGEGARLVDLYGAALAARARGADRGLVGADGLHPTTAGHRSVAEAFGRAL